MNLTLIPNTLRSLLLMIGTATLISSCVVKKQYYTPDTAHDGDILILNARVHDGTAESKMEKQDVLIRNGLIHKVGDIDLFPVDERELYKSTTFIDADGKLLTPGFIDTHSHGNPLKTPEFTNFLSMGVTTICLGQDGSSTRVGEMKSWFEDIESNATGVNIAPYVGHGTIRFEAGADYTTEPTSEQIQKMADLIDQALELGCFGMTTGLEYQPGRYATEEELAKTAQPVGKRGGVIMSHIRTEDDDQLIDSINELIKQGEASGAKVHVSHIKSVYGKGKERAEEILTAIDAGRARGVDVSADIYPYTASYTGLSLLFPEYALPPNNYEDVTKTRREELLDYLNRRVAKRNGPEATLFGSGEDAGKTLAEVAEEENKPYPEILLVKGPKGGSAAYFIMNEELQNRLMQHPNVNICSDGSPTMHHPRGHGSFAKIIAYHVEEKGALNLGQAIHKMTGLAAENSGIINDKRGYIQSGFKADLLLFDPDDVEDLATFENPKVEAKGFDTIIVNGKIARKDGSWESLSNGKLLKREWNL